MTKQFILCALAVLSLFSCGQRNSKQFPSPAKADAIISVFGEDNAALDPVRLCDAVLTTEEGMESAFPDETDSFFEETTPEAEAFYFPAADIKDELLARTVQLRYNYVALFNRVIHSYEWFQRASTGIADETTTRKDTLEWIRYARPKIPESVIRAALPDAGAQAQASKLLKAYNRFDGNDSAGSPFSVAVNRYTEALSGLPELVSKEETDRFEERFWNWYDKRNVVPEIDTLVRMNMYEYEGPKPSDGELENLKRAIEAEKDIDRRTVLDGPF